MTFPLTAPRNLHVGDEAICRDEEVTPARDVNASRLSFPLTLVLIIGSTVAGIVGTYETLSARIAVQDQRIVSLERQTALDAIRLDETRVIIAEIKGFMTATGMKEAKK